MDRKEFISKAGKGAAFALLFGCAAACRKRYHDGESYEDSLTPTVSVDFTIDLNHPDNAPLKDPEGYVYHEGFNVIIAHTKTGAYIAATRVCSDENLPGIIFVDNEYYCFEHDATYDENGKGTTTYNNLGAKGIKTYKTELNGNILRIYS